MKSRTLWYDKGDISFFFCLPGLRIQDTWLSKMYLILDFKIVHNWVRVYIYFRLLAQWLRQPLRDINLINERLDIVELLVGNSQLRLQLHEDHLRRIPDMQALARKLTKKKANLQDCYRIYQVCIYAFSICGKSEILSYMWHVTDNLLYLSLISFFTHK